MSVAQVIDDYALYHQTGGFRVETIVEITASKVSLIAQHEEGAGWSKLTFTLDETGPQPLQLEVRPWEAPRHRQE